MNIREISKPVTAKSLNESLARKFGKKIALEKFTLEQLQDVRNKLRTTLSQVETNESFNAVRSETYQKNKLFLDVLNAEITEREDVVEADKPDFADIDGDGDKKEPMKQAAKDKEKESGSDKKKDLSKVPPQLRKHMKGESVVKEGAEDQAEIVMAAKDMVNRVTSWMEDTAEMQTESMLELADAIRDEQGQEKSDAFVQTVKPALESLYTAMESTRESLTAGVGQLTGEAAPATDMGAEPEEPEMEPTVDADAAGGEELDVSLDAAPAGAGGEEEAGREKRESRAYKRKMLESSRRLGTILSKKK
jgi:uncharacterized FlgJ-related protein